MFLLYGLSPRWPGSTFFFSRISEVAVFSALHSPAGSRSSCRKYVAKRAAARVSPNSLLLTFWTTCKNKARLMKPGIFKLSFILCVYVGGQERKLLSCVSVARLQQGNVSFGAWITFFVCVCGSISSWAGFVLMRKRPVRTTLQFLLCLWT